MQAIQTRYTPATSASGAKIKALCAATRVNIPYDYALSMEENHITAAETLKTQMGWTGAYYGRLVSGTLADGSLCHVLTGRDMQASPPVNKQVWP